GRGWHRDDHGASSRPGDAGACRDGSAAHVAPGSGRAVLHDDASLSAGRCPWRGDRAAGRPVEDLTLADAFEELGLSDAIAEAARAAGYETPTPLQAAAIKVLRRGGNVALHASSGAGV